jgi:hypothetical protein
MKHLAWYHYLFCLLTALIEISLYNDIPSTSFFIGYFLGILTRYIIILYIIVNVIKNEKHQATTKTV